jgi:hypothetical protein
MIPLRLSWTIDILMSMLVSLAAIMIYSPIFVLVGIVIGIIGTFVGQIYVKAQLSFKREMSNAKAPVLAKFNGAVGGLGVYLMYLFISIAYVPCSICARISGSELVQVRDHD